MFDLFAGTHPTGSTSSLQSDRFLLFLLRNNRTKAQESGHPLFRIKRPAVPTNFQTEKVPINPG